MPLAEGPHLELLQQALAVEADGQRALLAGDAEAGRGAMAEAARLYRESWEVAPPNSFGRLIGTIKAAVIAGDPEATARYVRSQIPAGTLSPPAAYASAVAAVVLRDDDAALEAAVWMRGGSEPFQRTADAITTMVCGDAGGYAAAVRGIVSDFEGREDHLTGVPIADTALMLERLAEARGIAADVQSPLLP